MSKFNVGDYVVDKEDKYYVGLVVGYDEESVLVDLWRGYEEPVSYDEEELILLKKDEKEIADIVSKQSAINPDHYKNEQGKDLFDYFNDGLMTKDEVIGFYMGNIFKYVSRHRSKNGLEDLRKAERYIQELIKFEG